MNVQTSADPTASTSVASGAIGGQVTGVSFVMSSSDRVAGKTGCQATVTFTAATALLSGGLITLEYPSGFFDTSTTPGVVVAAGSVSASAFGATSVVLTLGSGAFVAKGGHPPYVLTLTGCTLGRPNFGSSVGIRVRTSQDFSSVGFPQ